MAVVTSVQIGKALQPVAKPELPKFDIFQLQITSADLATATYVEIVVDGVSKGCVLVK